MSYKYYFFDDQTVGAEDLNKLVNLFASEGVADNFENGVPYSLSKLNDTVYANVTEGIVPETNASLKVTFNAGYAYIEPGVAFFKDGTVIEIESTESLEAAAGRSLYIYLKSDALENRAYPCASESLDGDNIVPLAHISENGEVTDLRRFAKGKVPSFYASDAGVRIENTITLYENNEYVDADNKLTLIEKGNSYRYLMLLCRRPYENDIGCWWASTILYDTETDMCYSFSKPANGDYTDDYTKISKGTDFNLLDCWNGSSYYRILGNLYFSEGKAELKMTSTHNAAQSSFNAFTYPLEIKAIAC